MLQITNARTLRKLAKRIEEIAEVKSFLLAMNPEVHNNKTDMKIGLRTIEEQLLIMKKVKENAQITALLQEIRANLAAGNFDGAKAVANRVLEARPPIATPQAASVRQKTALESKQQ